MKTTLKETKNSYSNVRLRIPLVMISFPTNSPSREEWTCWKDVIRHCIDLVSHPFLFFPSFSLAMYVLFVDFQCLLNVRSKNSLSWTNVESVLTRKKKKRKRASKGEEEKKERKAIYVPRSVVVPVSSRWNASNIARLLFSVVLTIIFSKIYQLSR